MRVLGGKLSGKVPPGGMVLSNTKVAGSADPQTPVYSIQRNMPVRFRVLMPGGHSRNIVFALHGHEWDKEPYVLNSTRIGRNNFSFWEGARTGHGPNNHFDAYLRFGAGGKFGVLGDFLFRDQVGIGLDNGLWGILRVVPLGLPLLSSPPGGGSGRRPFLSIRLRPWRIPTVPLH